MDDNKHLKLSTQGFSVTQSWPTLCGLMNYSPSGSSVHEIWLPLSPPGIFPTQGLNWHLLHCRFVLPLSHLGSDQNWNPDSSYPNLLFSLSFTLLTLAFIQCIQPEHLYISLPTENSSADRYISSSFSPPLLPPAQSNHLLLGLSQ